MDAEDPREAIVDSLVARAQQAGCDDQTTRVLILTTRGLLAGLGEAQWTKEFMEACEGVRAGARDLAALGMAQSPDPRIRQVFSTAGQVEALLERWDGARRDLLRLGLWPWPANGDAEGLQPLCTPKEEQELHRLLEGLGDNM
jgi:hypothetical protein